MDLHNSRLAAFSQRRVERMLAAGAAMPFDDEFAKAQEAERRTMRARGPMPVWPQIEPSVGRSARVSF